MSVTIIELGNAIRSARIKKNYTQEHLAELLGITPAHLKHMEGGRRNPSVPLLFEMMELLNFSVDDLVFHNTGSQKLLYADGLTDEEMGAISHLIDVIRK